MGACQAVPQTEVCVENCFATMWVVKVGDFLRMAHPFPSHEELKASGLLYEWREDMLCIFVSHQWLGRRNPDPSGHQLRVLQQALENIMGGRTQVCMDTSSQFLGYSHDLSDKQRLAMKDAYIWLDWFSIPQVPEELSDASLSSSPFVSPTSSLLSHMSMSATPSTQEVQIVCIPNFIQRCEIFVVLVPPWQHADTGAICNYYSWLARGWCRAEVWCRMLSTFNQPMMVISASDQAEFATPLNWVDALPLEGDFTVAGDRQNIRHMLKSLLDQKLGCLLKQSSWDYLRFFTARRDILLGRHHQCAKSMEAFLEQFHFTSLKEAKGTSGMGPVACAVLSGNLEILEMLRVEGLDLNGPLKKMPDVGILVPWSSIFLAVKFQWRTPEVLRALLGARADAMTIPSQHALGMCRTAEDVELLIEYKAEVNQLVPPLNNPVIGQACMSCAPAEVVAKLLEYKAEVNGPTCGGSGASQPFANLALYANVNPASEAVAHLLISARADLNQQCQATGMWKAMELSSRAYLQFAQSSSPLVHLFAEWTTTPLGFACFFGRPALVQLLLDSKSDPEIRNARGKQPFDLTEYEDVLWIALKANVRSVVLSKNSVMI